MVVRLMTAEDYAGVYGLWINTAGVGLSGHDDSYEGICRYLKRNPSTCFVAEDGGTLVGVILSGHDGRRGFIYHAAVASDRRGRGIGSALVSASLNALKREGISKTALVAFASNENGNSFWEARGFTHRDDLVYRNKSLLDEV